MNNNPQTANRQSWENYPIDDPKRIDINLHFNERQFAKLKKGIIPDEMEDKWFVFYEDDWLYFHRSWTGFGIFKAKINRDLDGYSIKEFWAERKTEKYNNKEEETDIQTIVFLIARGLLGIPVDAIYNRPVSASPEDAIKNWSTFGRMMFAIPGPDYATLIEAALLGVAVGDALGVPVEFKSRKTLAANPVTGMQGQGTHNQPAGTWSDDSSLTFCLAEVLSQEFDIKKLSQNFQNWCFHAYWTAHDDAFDVGIATQAAIKRLAIGIDPLMAGGDGENSNGNGSLMRILPLLFFIKDKSIHDRFELTRQVSSLTHRHIRSVIACFYYLEFARLLLDNKDKFEIYYNLQTEITSELEKLAIDQAEIALFDRLLKEDISRLPEKDMRSEGYVLYTLEASVWCLLTTENYRDAVLKAVNLGEDTDTTAAVTGGLAGLLYGIENIPGEWINQTARVNDIKDLAARMTAKLYSQ